MNKKIITPKVFISYSHTSQEHIDWVVEIADRLSSDGVEVKLDQWDLREGQDKYEFMEQMVRDSKIKKVLIICDNEYQKKANSKTGGTGTETQIISKEVYEDVKQEKFIPIVKELYNGEPCLPTYLKNRMYINLSNEIVYEDNYERLIRNIFNKPLLKKPVIGAPPTYISDESPIQLKTLHYAKQLEEI